MARYAFRCQLPFYAAAEDAFIEEHFLELELAMGSAPGALYCPIHSGELMTRVYGDFQFCEDRLRFWRGKRGDGWSSALGGYMPDSRGVLRAVEKEKGVEMVSQSSMPESWKRMREHSIHVRNGGARSDSETLNPTDRTPTKTLRQLMDEKKVSLRP